MSFLDDLVSVNISATTRTVSRTGFGTPLFATYHQRFADRVRSYADLEGMRADGFQSDEPAYLMAAAAWSQSPRPSAIKIGRRASAFSQVLNINVPASPLGGDIFTATVDGIDCTYTAASSTSQGAVCTGLATAINALGVADAILASGGASSGSSQVLSGAALNGSVGRGAMLPARVLTVTLSDHVDWHATTGTIRGLDVDGRAITETFAIPSGGDATVALAKRFARVTEIDIPAQGGTGGTFTVGVRAPVVAVGSSGTHVACTAPAGELHSFAATENLSLTTATADPGIAADLAAIAAFDNAWYGLALDSQGKAEIEAAAAWVEPARKIFVAQTADAACGDPSSNSDVLFDLKATGYARTLGVFYPALGAEDAQLAAALLGNRLPADPGSDTWAYKTLVGVRVRPVSSTVHDAVLAKNGNTYEAPAGTGITYPGVTAAGEFMDVTRGLDWFRARMQERILAAQTANAKIPFTDAGIAILVTETRAQLTEGVRVGLFDVTPKPVVTAPRAIEVDTTDRQNRNLPSLSFSAKLAGAIHSMTVSGTVSA